MSQSKVERMTCKNAREMIVELCHNLIYKLLFKKIFYFI